jgi:hypothetical protein
MGNESTAAPATIAAISTNEFLTELSRPGERVSVDVGDIIRKDVDKDSNGTITREEAEAFIASIKKLKGLHPSAVLVANQLAERFESEDMVVGNRTIQFNFTYVPFGSEESSFYDGHAWDGSILFTRTVPLLGNPGQFFMVSGSGGAGLSLHRVNAQQLTQGESLQPQEMTSVSATVAGNAFVGINPLAFFDIPIYLGLNANTQGRLGFASSKNLYSYPIFADISFDTGFGVRAYVPSDQASQLILEGGAILFSSHTNPKVSYESYKPGVYVNVGYGNSAGASISELANKDKEIRVIRSSLILLIIAGGLMLIGN